MSPELPKPGLLADVYRFEDVRLFIGKMVHFLRDWVRLGEPTVGNGALTTVRWYDGEPVGDGYLRGQFQGLKDVVGDMIDRGVFSAAIAKRYIMEELAKWVGDRQELLIPSAEPAATSTNDPQS